MLLSRFLKLVYNELFKTYIRKSTWVMYAILLLLVIAGAMIFNSFADFNTEYTDNWREELQKENERYEKEILEFQEESYGDQIAQYNIEMIEKNNYHLENDIQPLNYGAWQYTLENAGLVTVISLLTIIIGAGIVSNEYRWGTIKLLLIRPITRTTILFSKFVAVFLFALFTLIFLLVSSLIVGSIVFGFEGFNPDYVKYTVDGIEQVPIIVEVLTEYGYNVVNLIMMTTLAFMISTIFKNSSLAIGVGIFLLMGGNIIVGVLSRYDWVKYILFANIDLKQYEKGYVVVEGMTFGFSVAVLIVYFVVFVVLSWLFFNKRDVVNQ